MTANPYQTQYNCELCDLDVNTILHCKSYENKSLLSRGPLLCKDCDLDEYTIMPKHITPALQLCSVHGGPQVVEAWCGVRLHTVWSGV